MRAPQGEIGPTGPIGILGTFGPQGITGPGGPDGPTGIAGQQGYQGIRGVPGPCTNPVLIQMFTGNAVAVLKDTDSLIGQLNTGFPEFVVDGMCNSNSTSISGMYLKNNIITLPEGSYYIEAMTSFPINAGGSANTRTALTLQTANNILLTGTNVNTQVNAGTSFLSGIVQVDPTKTLDSAFYYKAISTPALNEVNVPIDMSGSITLCATFIKV